MCWLIALCVLAVLAVLPLGVSGKYNADGPQAAVILGPVRFSVFPRQNRGKKEKKRDAVSDSREKEESPLPKAPQPPEEKSAFQKERGGSVADFLPLVKTALDLLGDFRRKLRVNRLEGKLILAGSDPCDLAISYGRAWAALGNLIPQLERLFVIKKRNLEVECDFTASQTVIIVRLDISITLGRLLALAARYGIRALREFLSIQKKRKGGAVK